MPFVMVSSAPGREQYDAVSAHLGLDDARPDGLLLHSASETPAGSIEIVDVWSSREQMQAFERERMFPAFQASGMAEQMAGTERPQAREPFHFLG